MRGQAPTLVEAGEYRGQRAVRVACTQLGTAYTSSKARRIVDDWVDLLSAGPTELTDLEFVTRTPKRLFMALSGQQQLQRLAIKWGDYADLGALRHLHSLRELQLRGASAVTDVAPLAELVHLDVLVVEGFNRITDASPLGRLDSLTQLELGGAWMSPRNGHLDSIAFLSRLPRLRRLLLHTLVVDDLDYHPLLSLGRLESVRVMAVRGMQPSHDELQRLLPWAE